MNATQTSYFFLYRFGMYTIKCNSCYINWNTDERKFWKFVKNTRKPLWLNMNKQGKTGQLVQYRRLYVSDRLYFVTDQTSPKIFKYFEIKANIQAPTEVAV